VEKIEKKDLIDALQAIPWFEQLSTSHFERLVGIAKLVTVGRGEDLFKEGDREDYLYIVLEGRVAIDIFAPSKGRIPIYTAEPLDVLGWSSVTPVVRQRTASARAVFDSRLVAFDAQGLRQACDEDHDLGYIIMRRLANVVAGRLLVTRLQLLDLFAHPNGKDCDD
jgi:CRP-like cAMP-binding protein